MSDAHDLGPLAERVPVELRGSSAYHVPKPPRVIAKLDANELPYGMPAEMRARLGAALAELTLERYPDPQAAKLRTLVAAHLGVQPSQLVFGNGSDELISMLCAAFAGPIAYPMPTFVYYRLAGIARGLPLVEVPLDAQLEIDEPAFSRAITEQRPSVVFLALPNNPTGTLWRPDYILELAAQHRDTVIVSDEAYFAYAGVTHLGELAKHPNLVIMRTLSKIGLAGLRVGFTISSPAIAHLLEKVRPPYNVSSLDQRAAEFALEHLTAWSTDRANEVIAERGRLAEALAARGLRVYPSRANLLLVEVSDAKATWEKLAAAGISVRMFGAGRLASCLRITVGTPAENAALLAAL